MREFVHEAKEASRTAVEDARRLNPRTLFPYGLHRSGCPGSHRALGLRVLPANIPYGHHLYTTDGFVSAPSFPSSSFPSLHRLSYSERYKRTAVFGVETYRALLRFLVP